MGCSNICVHLDHERLAARNGCWACRGGLHGIARLLPLRVKPSEAHLRVQCMEARLWTLVQHPLLGGHDHRSQMQSPTSVSSEATAPITDSSLLPLLYPSDSASPPAMGCLRRRTAVFPRLLTLLRTRLPSRFAAVGACCGDSDQLRFCCSCSDADTSPPLRIERPLSAV